MSEHLYLIALGSNQRHPRYGMPRKVLETAMGALEPALGSIEARAPIIDSDPVGPSLRRYANGAVLLASDLEPQAMLKALLDLESQFGRRRYGQSWRSRVLDLDIALWDGGIVDDKSLTIPHKLFRERDFVLGPIAAIAPEWRDPKTGLSLKQLFARLTRKSAPPRGRPSARK